VGLGMAPSNTFARVEFNQKFGMLSVYATIMEIPFICTSYSRTAAEQHRLFLVGGKTYCDGYEKISMHQLDRARDIAIVDETGAIVNDYGDHPSYAVLGEFWESLGGIWGGRWKDPYDIFHFEL